MVHLPSRHQRQRLAAGGDDEPGRVWCGTIPGGLFKSTDSGRSWAIVQSLWENPARRKWFGGGADWPGIHSICVDPRDPRTVVIAVSCGGVWRTRDAGETWTSHAKGMRAKEIAQQLAISSLAVYSVIRNLKDKGAVFQRADQTVLEFRKRNPLKSAA